VDNGSTPTTTSADSACSRKRRGTVEASGTSRIFQRTRLRRSLPLTQPSGRRALARHGLPAFLEELVPGLMHRIGDEWAASEITIAHEHVASAAVLAILFEAMRGLPEAPSARRLLVATPAGEHHGVGAALAATAAALDGWIIVYLGVDVPSAAIVSAAAATEARAILLSVVHTEDRELLLRNLRAVRTDVPTDVPIVVGGAAARDAAALLAGEGLIVCDTFADMREALARHSAAA